MKEQLEARLNEMVVKVGDSDEVIEVAKAVIAENFLNEMLQTLENKVESEEGILVAEYANYLLALLKNMKLATEENPITEAKDYANFIKALYTKMEEEEPEPTEENVALFSHLNMAIKDLVEFMN